MVEPAFPSTTTVAISSADLQLNANNLTIIFGVLATVLAIATIVLGVYHYLRMRPAQPNDLEMQPSASLIDAAMITNNDPRIPGGSSNGSLLATRLEPSAVSSNDSTSSPTSSPSVNRGIPESIEPMNNPRSDTDKTFVPSVSSRALELA
ncbi:hypothetical protein LTR27_012804 [Elasticomyces elasticus]|nr:hypothetical protein LTR27_012804 [Elasticomyces elasticus]